MRIDSMNTLKDVLERGETLWSGGWSLHVFVLEEFKPIKINGKSVRFSETLYEYHFSSDGGVEKTKTRPTKQVTISEEKIVFSHIPYFTTREECVDFFINREKDAIEHAKTVLKCGPATISTLEKIKQGDA